MRKTAYLTVPAVAVVGVVGAIAAVPQLRDFASAAPASPAAAPARQPSTTDPLSDQVASVPADNPASFKDSVYRPRPAVTVRARRSPKAHPRTADPVRTTAAPRPSDSTTAASGRGTIRCSGTEGMLPANYAAIVAFLTAHGYTGLAAAGIAGNIYQESRGNPESVGSGGGGLIGWTPLPAGFVTGSTSADLQTQLNALLTFNQQWAQFIPALNAATSAASAAYVYMSDFERPGIPAASNREAAATAVAAACGLLGLISLS
jgi:hypothetical protein